MTGYLVGTPARRPVGAERVGRGRRPCRREAGDAARPLRRRGAGWIDEGRTAHFALVPAADTALVDAWFRLCFGLQHVQAVREVPADAPWPDGCAAPRRSATRRRSSGSSPSCRSTSAAHRRSPWARRRPTSRQTSSRQRDPRRARRRRRRLLRRRARRARRRPPPGRPARAVAEYAGPARPEGIAFLGYAATAPGGARDAASASPSPRRRSRGRGSRATPRWRPTGG